MRCSCAIPTCTRSTGFAMPSGKPVKTMSDPVTTFEARFASMIGADYAIAVNSGTSALHCALEALEVRGGEVIMPALGPGLVAFPILAAGAAPVFADVDPVTQLISR